MAKETSGFSETITQLSEENAAVLISIVLDPTTPEHVKIRALNSLIEAADNDSFFDLLLENKMDYYECPKCNHKNHWLIPEVELNQRGYFSFEKDKRVKKNTTISDCEKYQQACTKKKLDY